MKMYIYLLIVIFFSNLSFAKFYPIDPVKFNKKVRKHVHHHVKKNPSVYFLSDDHSVDQSKLLKALIEELVSQDSYVDCLFLEMPFRYMQTALENYFRHGIYESIIGASDKVHRLYETQSSTVKERQRKEILTLAKTKGLKLFAIDELPSVTTMQVMEQMYKESRIEKNIKKYNYYLEFLKYHYGVKRNRVMADKISGLLSKSCKKAISINGYSHLTGQIHLDNLGLLYRPLQLIIQQDYNISFRKLKSK